MAEPCVQDLFEAQVKRTPRAVAVVFGEERLTYQELNGRANRLAHRLRRLGVGPEILVGLCMKRSPEMVIGLLGVLKAGGAYVPLDPTYPRERLAFMLEDTRAPVLLTQPPLLRSLPAHAAQVLCLDPACRAVADEPEDNPSRLAGADSLAYVIYTSGSTGRPKGVMVPHRALSNYLSWCTHAYAAAAGTGAPVQSSISFDLTVTSLFAPLLAGRAVHLLREGNAVDELRAAFQTAADFSLVKITPAHLELLGQHLDPHEAPGRTRAFIIGGENLTGRHIAFWQSFAPGTVLINEYGPTETAVGCCVYRVPAGGHRPGSVPIGRPIANTRLYVLDAGLRPVPSGEPGELYIGGAGVARGYHDRPDLTAERFVPDPFGDEPGSRMYRTGDLVRALPEGDLEFLGRLDRQVKVRGVRIELEEIEAVLAEHPAVRTVAVLAREDTPGERRLVAYVVPHPGRAFGTAELRDFLKGRLPEHMVPSALVQLEKLPLTCNGKVDVQALPPPRRTHLELTGGLVSAQTALEAQMVRLWETVLGIRPVGVRDDFFALGGDSLLAARLFAQIHKVFGRDLPAASLLEAPTVERLVQLLERPAEADAEASLVPLQPHGARPPFFCVHAIVGDALGFADLARHLGPDQPFYGLRARRSEDHRRPASLEALAARYLDEIRAFQPHGPYFLGGFSFGGTVAFEMARQLRAQGEAVGLLAVLDQRPNPGQARAPFRPAFLVEFLKNLPRWVWYDLCQSGPSAMLTRLRLRIQGLLTRPPRQRDGRGSAPGAATRKAGEVFDLDRLPESYRKLLEYHYQLLLDYKPQAYAGRVTLLRAKAQPLSRLQAGDLGWSELAAGGVEVIAVPGSHDNLLKEPYVRVLAERLGACLRMAQAGAAPRASLTPAPPAALTEGPSATGTASPSHEKPLTWRVVVNDEGQYSLWPSDRAAPPGWTDAGRGGSRDECLAYIRAVWDDLRPLGLRESSRPELALAAAPAFSADGAA
jgi:amino acid adenylation domain-containing protein